MAKIHQWAQPFLSFRGVFGQLYLHSEVKSSKCVFPKDLLKKRVVGKVI